MSPAEPGDAASPSGGFSYEHLVNGWQAGRFDSLSKLPGVVHLVTTRHGLDPQIARDEHAAAARQIAQAMGVPAIAWCRQVHGSDVRAVSDGGDAGECDGLVTKADSLGLLVRGADCPLILAADAAADVIGAAHASWRGTRGRMASRLIDAMAQLGAEPSRVVVCLCPSAGPCCYEVGPEVRQQMTEHVGPHAEAFFTARGEKFHLDLWAANADELARAGVEAGNIHVSRVCTICNNDRFPSYRAEGQVAGRFVAVIARV